MSALTISDYSYSTITGASTVMVNQCVYGHYFSPTNVCCPICAQIVLNQTPSLYGRNFNKTKTLSKKEKRKRAMQKR